MKIGLEILILFVIILFAFLIKLNIDKNKIAKSQTFKKDAKIEVDGFDPHPVPLDNKLKVDTIRSRNNPTIKEDDPIPPPHHYGFHDYFAIKNGFDNGKIMGWRHYFNKNKLKYNVEKDENFEGVPTNNYLKNMNHLDWFPENRCVI